MFVRLLRKRPLVGLILGLSVEAWIPIPGELLIASAAAQAMSGLRSLARLVGAGLTGMVINDLSLYTLSAFAHDFSRGWISRAHLHLHHVHINWLELLAAKFLPPVRSATLVVYGFQGTHIGRFLAFSVLTSLCWVGAYAVLGRLFKGKIVSGLKRLDSGGRLLTVLEVAVTVVTTVLLIHPF
jgi:membrane protein DedA with SNARE-associated domain